MKDRVVMYLTKSDECRVSLNHAQGYLSILCRLIFTGFSFELWFSQLTFSNLCKILTKRILICVILILLANNKLLSRIQTAEKVSWWCIPSRLQLAILTHIVWLFHHHHHYPPPSPHSLPWWIEVITWASRSVLKGFFEVKGIFLNKRRRR